MRTAVRLPAGAPAPPRRGPCLCFKVVLPRLRLVLALHAALAAPLAAQGAPEPATRVDHDGVWRWAATGQEVALFGVNYAAPFAYDYRAIARVGQDRRRAIDDDVAHLARMGIDAFRLHVWDREVSDSAGNLLENEHLDLLDHLIAQLEGRGIKVILTPIGWWGPGYPEPDAPSPGFSNRFSKGAMSVDTVARRLQMRYLAQFIVHVNRETGRSYRDDPDLLAIEIFNEPHHEGGPAAVTGYIEAMVAALRGAGLRKPIFYNISEQYTPEHGHAVCASPVQGVSAQWYPTGLVRGAMLPGNPLPMVDRYALPFADFPECRDKARMVYEFDAADVMRPVMYPAMARSFRGAGFQWATQFAYDPLAIAHTNTEYQTHYLNLVYTPAKAISVRIAGEVFRALPRGFDAGTYPASTRFGAARLDAAAGVSEWITDSLYLHAGSTSTVPPEPGALRHVAAVGSSPVARYDGTGAYFLDRLADGVWRLEVYPDAVPVEDPFSRGNLARTVTRVYWREHALRLALPNLGDRFTAVPLDATNRHTPSVTGGVLRVRPGVYLLARAGARTADWRANRRVGALGLREFHAPPSSAGPLVVRHVPPEAVESGRGFSLRVEVVQEAVPDSVVAWVRWAGWRGFRAPQRLAPVGPYTYEGTIAADSGRTGRLEYVVTVYSRGTARSFPSDAAGAPTDWDHAGAGTWSTRVVPTGAPVVLFDAERDRERLVLPGFMDGVRYASDWVGGGDPLQLAWRFALQDFGPRATRVDARTMLPPGAPARASLVSTSSLLLRARAGTGAPVQVELALILTDGTAWGTTVTPGAVWAEIAIPLMELRQVPLTLLPRPYPPFLPYDLMVQTAAASPDLRLLEGLQWALLRPASGEAVALEVERVELR